MNIQQEIVKHYNETVVEDKSFYRYFSMETVILDLFLYTGIINIFISSGSDEWWINYAGKPFLIFVGVLILGIGISSATGKIGRDNDGDGPIGPFSYFITSFKRKKEIKKAQITSLSSVEPSIFSNAFKFYSSKLDNDYVYVINQLRSKLDSIDEHQKKIQNFKHLDTKKKVVEELNKKLSDQKSVFVEQLSIANQARNELKEELNSVLSLCQESEELYSITQTYNLIHNNEEDIVLITCALERLSSIKDEVILKIKSEEEAMALSIIEMPQLERVG